MNKLQYPTMYEQENNNWWFKGKRILVKSMIKKHIKKYNSLLDIGCGAGLTLIEFKNNCKQVYGVDISYDAVKLSKKRQLKNIYLKDFSKEHIKNKKFDLILLLDVLEHIEDDSKTLQNIKKNMNNDSYLIINVPAFQFLWTEKDNFVEHKRRYTRRELIKLLELNNFQIIRCTYTNFFIFPLAILMKIKDIFSFKNRMKNSIITVPKVLNDLMITIYKLESKMLNSINFPFGTSILCVVKIKKDNFKSK